MMKLEFELPPFPLTEEEKRALQTVLEYMTDEKEDYITRSPEQRKGHIFQAVLTLRSAAYDATIQSRRVTTTRGHIDLTTPENQEIQGLYFRHLRGDWGDVLADEWRENDRAVWEGGGVFSSYKTSAGETIQIFTDGERRTTTVVLPPKSDKPKPMRYTAKPKDEDFGGCPECGENDGFLNIHRTHWFICHTHKTKWLRGDNLFGSWRFQTPDEWQENHESILDYEEVHGCPPPDENHEE